MKLAAGLAFVLAMAPAVALADTPPTVWDLAKNPDAFAQRRQHLAIERDIETVDALAGDPQLIAHAHVFMAEDNARMLVEAYAGRRDAWLRFDQAWVAMRRQQWAAAIPILEGLAKELGHSAFSLEVWQKLAECYVHLERTPDEIRAYDEVLARASTDLERLTPMLNQGEAYMRSGDADGAVSRFRELLDLAAKTSNADITLLADWDLTVALDRSGDFRRALEKSRETLRTTQVALLLIKPINATVYFVPEYERSWYLALGEAGLALEATKPREAADHWRAAESEMTSYVNGATLHGGDKWLDLARRRLDEIRRRRAEADKRVPPHAREDDLGL